VQFVHEIEVHSRNGPGNAPDCIFQGAGEVTSVTVGLQAAGLDDMVSPGKDVCKEEPPAPREACILHLLPATVIKFVQHNKIKTPVLRQGNDAQFRENISCRTTAAALGKGEFFRLHLEDGIHDGCKGNDIG
jgi:hypothetical protein